MKVRILLALSFLVLNNIYSQTVIYTENWAGGGAGWTLNVVTGPEGADPNFWKVSAEEGGGIPPNLGAPGSCGVPNNGNNTLFVTSVFNPTGGAAYDAGGLCGVLFCPQANRRTESPIINCTGQSTLTLNFNYIEGGDGTNDDGTVWYNDGTGFVLLDNPPKTLTGCGGQGLWVSRSVALPASANNNPLVQIAFGWINNDDGVGTDPSFAVDDITITVPAAATPVASIAPSPNDSLCQASTLTLNGSATNGPILTWAWTANPSAGVTFIPNAAAQNPTVTFTTPGTYTFSLIATNGSGASAPATQVITILPATVTSVTITASPLNPICAGTTVNFTATPTNGGGAPSYQWQVNAVNAGVNSPNFSSSTLNNNDVITVTVTSSDSCSAGPTASNSYTVTVNPTLVPAVSIVSDVTVACAGTAINFTATPTNGGITPAYQWQVNGSNVGANSTTFSSTTLNNGDLVTVILTSNAICASPASVTSNTITIAITPTVVPTATITANPGNPICAAGTTINFTATPTNGGATPVYQWQVNGVNAGVNSPNFSSSTLVNNDVVSVIVTSNAACVTPSTVTATYTVIVNVPPVVNITHGTATVCPNTSDTLIATATAGSTFTWTPAAGLNVTNNDSVIFASAVLGIHTYYVTATLNGCSATDSVKVTVSAGLVATAGPTQTICSGNSANLSVNGGTAWAWSPAGSLSCNTCQNPIATPTATTIYTVVASVGACTDTVTQTVIVIPTASASFNTSVINQGIPQTIGFTNTSSNANTFFWTLGNGSTSVLQTPANQIYPAAGNYTVTLIAYGTNGCNDTISTVISVIDTVGITTPNIFTPNGDEINDVWQPSAHGAKTFECTIFNRWGIMIYDFISSQDKWDGHTTSGEVCSEGTYYYILKATDLNGKAYNLKGFIQLIR